MFNRLQALRMVQLATMLLGSTALATSTSTPTALSQPPAALFADLEYLHAFLPALHPAQLPLQEDAASDFPSILLLQNLTITTTTSASIQPSEQHTNDPPIHASSNVPHLVPTTTISPTYNPPPNPLLALEKRASSICGTSHTPCISLSASSLCCPLTAACSRDYLGTVACCPYGAVCTGYVSTAYGGGGVSTTTVTSTGTTTTQQGGGQQTTTTTVGTGGGGNAGTQPGFIQVSGVTVATVAAGAAGGLGREERAREVLALWVGGAVVGGVLYMLRI